MKRAPIFVLAGTVAGLAGILSFHTRPITSSALSGDGVSRGSEGSATSGSGIGGDSHGGAANGVRAAEGATEQYGFGELAVEVMVRGDRIVNVTVPLLQTGEQYSEQLAMLAIPRLRYEVLTTQSARIHGVTGASYTSQAYVESLQAALDKLHIR
jgi:uncharacterized protein with FMN-binding domain